MRRLLIVLLLTGFSQAALAQSVVKWEDRWSKLAVPEGWQVINRDGSAFRLDGLQSAWIFTGALTAPSGDSILPKAGQVFAFSVFNHANNAGLLDEWLLSPRLPVIDSGDSLVFFAGATDDVFKDSLKVYVSTTDSLVNSFKQEIGYFKVDGPDTEYHRYAFDLTPFAGRSIFAGLQYYIRNCGPEGTHGARVYVDHFQIVNSVATSVQQAASLPDEMMLEQNYPNPFNPETAISFSLQKEAEVSIFVRDIQGRQVAVPLPKQIMVPGNHKIRFDGSGLAAGVYFYTLESDLGRAIRKMTVLR